MLVLVIDDDASMREVLEMRLQHWGFEVVTASDGHEAPGVAAANRPDIIVSDVVMPGVTGLELLPRLIEVSPGSPVIMMTAEGTIDMAVEAMKQGAEDFVTKPLDYSKLRALLAAVSANVELRHQSKALSAKLDAGAGFGEFVGMSRPMREVYKLLREIGATDTSVIIAGESGTGKELAARTIHTLSARAQGPFVAINSAAIPENLVESELFGHERGAFTGAVAARAGCFEMAHRGTLFLDEISEMPAQLQPKLLRVLEDGKIRRIGASQETPIDVRILAATNREPHSAVADGHLREDLFYRLNVFTVALPPLRERTDDIPLLVQSFIREFNSRHSLAVEAVREEAFALLRGYDWPGNVRELRNVMERAVILAKARWIEPSHLPVYMAGRRNSTGKILLQPGVSAADAERQLILDTLRRTRNNKAEAARQLGLDVKTIRNKLKGWGMA
jgi:DNA-binding NtrC family response regulator